MWRETCYREMHLCFDQVARTEFSFALSLVPSWIGRGVFFPFLVIGASRICMEMKQSGYLVCSFPSSKAFLVVIHWEVNEKMDGASIGYQRGWGGMQQ